MPHPSANPSADDDHQHLVAASWPEARMQSSGSLRNFSAMTVFFALTHGCVTALVPLASIEFGDALGPLTLGVLYVLYTLTAMCGATLVVGSVGPKWGLVAGLAVYCVYVASFLLASTVPALRWPAGIGGAAIGGVGGGFLWTAQGAYFSLSAASYATSSGVPPSEATSWLGGAFASCYLGAEILLKLLSSGLQYWPCRDEWEGSIITGKCPSSASSHGSALGTVFAVYTVIAVGASAAMAFVGDVQPAAGSTARPTPLVPPRHWSHKSLEALTLMRSDKRVLLLSMLNLTFGFSSAFVNTYLTGVVIPKSPDLGPDKVGYLVSIIPLTATLLSMPLAAVTKRLQSKTPAMVFGGVSYVLFFLPFVLAALAGTGSDGSSCVEDSSTDSGELDCLPDSAMILNLGQWGVLVPLLVLNGAGRAVWESTNKSVFADAFPEQPAAGFANVELQSGGATAIAFFLFPGTHLAI